MECSIIYISNLFQLILTYLSEQWWLLGLGLITGPRLAALGFALLLCHLFVDRINLSLGVNNVFVSERTPAGLMMQLLQQLH